VRLLVVGEPRSGKTSWSSEYMEGRRKCGSSVGGVLSPAIEKQGQRVGSDALDFLTGQEVPFLRLSCYGCFNGRRRREEQTRTGPKAKTFGRLAASFVINMIRATWYGTFAVQRAYLMWPGHNPIFPVCVMR
jgi:hypothetical protein